MRVLSWVIIASFVVSSCRSTVSDDHGHNHDHHDHHDHSHHDHGDEDHHHHPELADNELEFSDAQAKMIGMQTEVVKSGEFHETIRTVGRIESPLGEQHTVVAQANGVVRFIEGNYTAGSELKARERIAYISSKNLMEGDPLERLRVQMQADEENYERAQQLIQDSLISLAEYSAIRAEYEQSRIRFDALAEQNTDQGLIVSSSQGGYISRVWVTNGEYVNTGQPLLTINSYKRTQLTADVSVRQSYLLPSIRSANFITPDGKSYTLEELNGQVVSHGKQVVAQSSFIPVIFEFDQPDNLVLGSSVEVYLKSNPISSALTLPLSALIEEQGLYFVFSKKSNGIYEKIPVQRGSDDGFRVIIVNGLEEGMEIVTHGAYYLKLAGLSTEIPHGHTH